MACTTDMGSKDNLVESLKQGTDGAIEALVEKYARSLYSVSWRMLRNTRTPKKRCRRPS